MFQFPSVNELRARFAEAKYIVEQDTIRQVYRRRKARTHPDRRPTGLQQN